MTTTRRSSLQILASVAAALLAACSVTPEEVELPPPVLASTFADQSPEWLPHDALDFVVALYDPLRGSLASGIVVGPGLLLTAAHFAEALRRDDRGDTRQVVDGVSQRVRLVAIGSVEAKHGDWAVIALPDDQPRRVATLHEPALDPAWAPARGTEILLVGYAAGFFPGLQIDLGAPTPCIRARIDASEPQQRSWYAVGDAVDLGGMSGGAAVVWNRELRRAEVIGVFRGYVGMRHVSVEEATFLGVKVGERITSQPDIAFEIHRLPAAVLP